MKRAFVSLVLAGVGASILYIASVSGAAPAIFGPEHFVRQKRAPAVELRQFSGPDRHGPCLLRVHNGGDQRQFGRISSAVVRLNGRDVTGPSAFNQKVGLIERPVTIRKTNTLAVELRSAPGSGLTVEVACEQANQPPVASAGPDQTTAVGRPVTLDGGSSSDPDGDPLSYAWAFDSVPAGSTVTLSDPSAIRPVFTPDRPGQYSVGLVVSDGELESVRDVVVVSTVNSSPVAHAGEDQTARVTETVILDGSRSTDIDGDALRYRWSLASVPQGSAAAVDNPSSVRPHFIVDRPGTYVAELVVDDGTTSSPPDAVVITTLNSAPIADAGPDQSVVVGRLAQLDGSDSRDADGDALTFEWSLIATPTGSQVVLMNPATSRPTFAPDLPGDYVAQLLVRDPASSSALDTVTISTTDSAPIANAGPDQVDVPVGTEVHLDGSRSNDPDGQAIGYSWALLARPETSQAVLTDPSAAQPSFSADVPGEYVAQLIVNDGLLSSAPDTVSIRTLMLERIEIAPAPAIGVARGEAVQFSARGTFSNGTVQDPLPAVVWTTSNTAVASATLAGLVTGVSVGTAAISASRDGIQSLATTVTVLAPPANQPPVVNAGADIVFEPTLAVPVEWARSSTRISGGPIATQVPAALDLPVDLTDPAQVWDSSLVLTGTRPTDRLWASWTGPGVCNAPSVSSVLRFRGMFAVPDRARESGVRRARLLDPYYESRVAGGVIPINDALYVYANRQFVERRSSSYLGQYPGYGDSGVENGGGAIVPETGWYTRTIQVPEALLSLTGTNQLDVIGEDTCGGGGLGFLSLELTLANTVRLPGAVSDDGLPLGTVTASWTKVSGPGDVAFAEPNSAETNATFSAPGEYLLRLVADDSSLSASDDISVTIGAANEAPATDAGPDHTVPLGQSLTLVGQVSDDARPAGAGLITRWSVLSGPGTATFGSPTSTSSTVQFSAVGRYELRLMGYDTQLRTSDVTVIDVVAQETPTLNEVAPNTGVQGQTVTVTIQGVATHFVQGTTTVDFGEGIGVSSVSVLSSTSLVATLNIGLTAQPGIRIVSVTTSPEVARLANAFTVVGAVGHLTRIDITPAIAVSVNRGQAVQFSALGTFSDGSVEEMLAGVQWTSDGIAAAVTQSGLVSGTTAGIASVRASSVGIQSAPTTVTVKPPAPTIREPILEGATAVSGSRRESGGTIQLLVNGAPRSALVEGDTSGNWTALEISGALSPADRVAAVQAVGGIRSDVSVPVVVRPPQAAHVLGVVRIEPTAVMVGAPATVTVQASIADSTLLPGSVTLMQVDANGVELSTLGTLRDDGADGDMSAGDTVYTGLTTVTAASEGQINLQVSAQFQDQATHVLSRVLPVYIQGGDSPRLSIQVLAQSLASGNIAAAMEGVVQTRKMTNALAAMSLEDFATLSSILNSGHLVSASPRLRIYQTLLSTPDGDALTEFSMIPGPDGRWLLSSW